MKHDPRIVITGFMASGKTSVARALADLLHCDAVDLDEMIAGSTGRTPADIINEDGEQLFRNIESQELGRVLEPGRRVVALGGGAWTVPANRDLINSHDYFSVWLDVPFEVCWKRIVAAKRDRPLAKNDQAAKKLYDQRRTIYATAGLRLQASDEEASKDVAKRLAAALDESGTPVTHRRH